MGLHGYLLRDGLVCKSRGQDRGVVLVIPEDSELRKAILQ